MMPDANVTFGFLWICVGLLLGAPMALAFLRPSWLGGYGSLERRLLRLAHVAFVMLGLLNIVYGHAMNLGAVSIAFQSPVCVSLFAGSVLMPLCLLAGILWRKALWSLPVPFLLVFSGAVCAAAGRFP